MASRGKARILQCRHSMRGTCRDSRSPTFVLRVDDEDKGSIMRPISSIFQIDDCRKPSSRSMSSIRDKEAS